MKIRRVLFVITLLALACTPSVAQGQKLSEDEDLSGVKITLKADADHCYGARCPVYSVSVSGDGAVIFEGVSNVLVTGRRSYKISTAKVRKLVTAFKEIDFFSLKDVYNDHTQDHAPGVTVMITIGSKTKSVYDFLGAPSELTKLEKRILETTGVNRLIKRD